MKLKAIEMQGFKSFPERTKMTFEGGMTAIIGPNGSGKSNISDAIRWVLGEMSAKSLRGSKMEDVIFNGTPARPAANYASVSLYLDTTEEYAAKNGIEGGEQPGDVPDVAPKTHLYDEEQFVITRKYYRSGESEYYINKKQVRLKDVYELFYDTGIGREGYSVIGQGKISEVLSVKGDERRSIFEEASGISKYRVKKNESERKLRDAELNLARVNDIFSEVESRVEPLRKEAENAKQYLVLADEKKRLEISLWLEKTDSLRGSLDDGERVLASAHLELDLAAEEFSAVEKEEEDFTNEGYRLMQRKSELNELTAEVSSQTAELVRMNSVYENDAVHLTARIEAGKREENVVTGRRASVAEQIASAEREYAEIMASAAMVRNEGNELTARRDALMAPGADAKRRCEECESTVRRCAGEISAVASEAASCRVLIESIGKRGGAFNERLDKSNERLSGLGVRKAALEADFAGVNEKLTAGKGRLADIAAEQSQLEAKRAAAEKSVSSLRVKAAAAEQQRESLLRLERLFEGYSDSVKTVMRHAAEGRIKRGGAPVKLRGTVSSLLHTEGDYVVAIETALGASVQFIVSETEDDAKAALSYLKMTGGGRITVLPLDTVRGKRYDASRIMSCDGFVGIASDLVTYEPDYRGIADELLGRTVIASDLEKASAIARKCGYNVKIVTVDGQIINAGGSYTGGSSQKKVGLFTRNTDIEKLDEEITSINGELTNAELALRSVERKISSLRDEAAGVNEELEVVSAEADRVRGELSEATAIYGEEEANRDGILEMCAGGKTETDRLSERLAECEEKEKLLNAEKEKAEKDGADALAELRDMTAGADDIKEKLNELGMRLISYNAKAESSADRLDELKERLAEEDEKLSEIAAERDECERTIDENSAKAAENTASIEKLRGSVAEMDAEKKDIDTELEKREATKAERRARLKSAQIRKEQAFESFTRLETGQKAAREEYDTVLARLWEEYELSYTAAEEFRLPPENREKMPARLNSVKAKIRAMGAINVKAVEEYEEIKERYDFLKGQIDDLSRTIRKLNSEIARLDSTMETVFLETFTAINSAFGRVFAELFGGGSARLELTDPEHPLECGIDIILHPPGKSVRSISLLSGGEQSFAAIALYLSLQEINPSPFCVFDEIEAALDEVNQARLMDYIRAHCESTQYILITHRRGTMERSNVLYGITMREKGVSEYLRLNLSTMGDKIKEYTDSKV